MATTRTWTPRVGSTLVLLALLVVAGCGSAAAPTPTPDNPDTGECVDMTGPEDDLTITVVDCATAPYEVVNVIEKLTSDATCPPTTDLEIERTLQFVQPGQTPDPARSGVQTQTICLREQGPAPS